MKRKHPSAITHDLQPAATQATATSFTPITPQLKTGDGQAQAAGPAVYQVNHSIQPFAVQRSSTYYETEKTSERTPFIQREPKNKTKQTPLETCMQTPELILPPMPGKSAAEQGMMLKAMLGIEAPAIIAAIRNNPAARSFVCEHGIPAIAVMVETRNSGAFNVSAARKRLADPQHKDHFKRDSLEGWRLADQYKKQLETRADHLSDWTQGEQRKNPEEFPTRTTVLKTPDMPLADIPAMINSVQAIKNLGDPANLISQGQAQLNAILEILRELGDTRDMDKYGDRVIDKTEHAIAILDSFEKVLFTIYAGRADLDQVRDDLKTVRQEIRDIRANAYAQQSRKEYDYGSLKRSVNNTRGSNEAGKTSNQDGSLKALRDNYALETEHRTYIFKHADTLLFVLRYFLALNDPGAAPPTEADLNTYNKSLEKLEISFFFGSGKSDDLMRNITGFIQRQTAMRLQMQAATKALPGMVPTLAEATAYFKTLRSKAISNEVVRQAYMDFAQAWFKHRGDATMADLEAYATADVFAMPTSIVGARTIVCSGFAVMGAALMLQAGASKVRFINALRASDEEIVTDKIGSGHTVAEITRHGKVFYISNDATRDTPAQAMSPLGTADKLYKATGDTHKASLDKLKDILKTTVERLQKNSGQP